MLSSFYLPDVHPGFHRLVHVGALWHTEGCDELGNVGERSVAAHLVWAVRIQRDHCMSACLGRVLAPRLRPRQVKPLRRRVPTDQLRIIEAGGGAQRAVRQPQPAQISDVFA